MDENENKNKSSPPSYEELADILVAISVVAKRLSKEILRQVTEECEKEGVTNGS